jgi:putative transposase
LKRESCKPGREKLPLARKSLKQYYSPSVKVLGLMREFKQMTNDCIRIGLASKTTSLKRLSLLSYKELKRFEMPSHYKLSAISRASGILASRKKSIRRGFVTKDPYLRRSILISYTRFKIINGKLRIPLGNKKFEEIRLSKHIQNILSDLELEVRSFTLTETSLSLCVSKEVPAMQVTSVVGVDRNLRNLTVGSLKEVAYYDMNRVIEIGETTKDLIRSFRRNDFRILKKISSKYGHKKTERVKRILHIISKEIVQKAGSGMQGIVFEDIRGIRSLYQKGNYQGKDHRRQMNNHWPFAEIKRQIEYKAQWSGVPIIRLTKSETRGTSSLCYQCGERLQGDKDHKRKLWCQKCGKWFDRDMVAVMNISNKGWLMFDHSKGEAGEAMVQESNREVAILRVDVSKSIPKRTSLTCLQKI